MIYKEKGIDTIRFGLLRSYRVLSASPEIKEITTHEWEIKIKYEEHFCPIGGRAATSKKSLIQELIYIPYTIAFLNEMDSEYSYKITSKACILTSGNSISHYILRKTSKKENSDVQIVGDKSYKSQKGIFHYLKDLFKGKSK